MTTDRELIEHACGWIISGGAGDSAGVISDLVAAIERLSSGSGWRPIETAPRDEIIWVWCPATEGLSEMTSLCQWHEDAGFCVDEIRQPAMWQRVAEPSPPSEQGREPDTRGEANPKSLDVTEDQS